MSTKVQVIFHSLHGHVYALAEAIAAGARSVEQTQVDVFQVPELLSEEVLKKMNALESRKKFAHIPVAKIEQLAEADAIIFGAPTRFGNMSGQMKSFLDQGGGLWARGTLIGKVGSVFASTASQHGGQEMTITNFHTSLLHFGMVIVGVPYSAPGLENMTEISGGTPYGATTLAAHDGSRMPSENELEIARFQGKHVAQIAAKLSG